VRHEKENDVRERIDFKDKNLAERGFTLVELLVVIIILGILAAVVVFAVSGITDKGEQSACEIERRQVQTALEAYYAKNDAYPANLSALVPDFLDEAPSASSATGGGSYDSSAGKFTASC
jgi:general secretion pathway protein G